jgi:hypothetical protein
MRWVVHVARIGRRRCAYRVLLENLKKRDHLGNKGVDLTEVRRGFVDWTDLAENRGEWRAVVNTAMILRFAQNKRNFLTS